jgi:hypothetical protein
MHPELEDFLEDALAHIRTTSPQVGRVVVEPDYEVAPADGDAGLLQQQLGELLARQSPDAAALASPEGYEVRVPEDCPLLGKYLRSITLHQDRVKGSLVEVAPPGNWI